MTVDVVIVNWNAGSQLVECVYSILDTCSNLIRKIIVVDNGSVDDSLRGLDGLEKVVIVPTGRNIGFAAACNIGSECGDSDYILFLNPDTRLNKRSLSLPLFHMEKTENANIGICGIQLYDESGCIARSCASFPTLRRFIVDALGLNKVGRFRSAGVHAFGWAHDKTQEVDHVIGAFYLVRRFMFDSLGGFDSRFFLYLEDVDLSYRAHQARWKSLFIADVSAFHVGGGTSRRVKALRLFYSLRSRLMYAFKHFPQWQAWVLLGLTAIFEPISRSVWCIARGDVSGFRHTLSAYCLLWRGMGKIVKGDGRFVS